MSKHASRNIIREQMYTWPWVNWWSTSSIRDPAYLSIRSVPLWAFLRSLSSIGLRAVDNGDNYAERDRESAVSRWRWRSLANFMFYGLWFRVVKGSITRVNVRLMFLQYCIVYRLIHSGMRRESGAPRSRFYGPLYSFSLVGYRSKANHRTTWDFSSRSSDFLTF